MITYPQFDPVIFGIGPLQFRWYGLMYVIGFAATYILVRKQINEQRFEALGRHFETLNICLIASLVLGGRLGYVLFYNLPYYLEHPGEIIATWQGGMSFHGALIGIILGGFLFCRLKGLPFLRTADMYIITVPIGIGFGRIGNFINAELFGRASHVPWAMVFPGGGPEPRHPSQLYECFLEGIVLFIVLWSLRKQALPKGAFLAIFLILYGLFRIMVEFFREPDPQVGVLMVGATMGQILSMLMILTGGALLLGVSRSSRH